MNFYAAPPSDALEEEEKNISLKVLRFNQMSVSCQVERGAELISKYSRRNGLGYSEQVTQAQLDRAGTGWDASSLELYLVLAIKLQSWSCKPIELGACSSFKSQFEPWSFIWSWPPSFSLDFASPVSFEPEFSF